MACEEAGGFRVLSITESRERRAAGEEDRDWGWATMYRQEHRDYAAFREAAYDEFARLRAVSLAEHAGLSLALRQRDAQLARVRWAVRLDEALVGLLALAGLAWEWLCRVRWHRFDRGNVSPLVKVSVCVAVALGVLLVGGLL